ncbi:MAG: hypothetical protein M1820_007195 [Bogoriella megaspora]|nr:MAG: hypothetical protein M1820_007195 [Bogoriella megaspora]
MDNRNEDAESFSDELSPTDGYFNPRHDLQDTYVMEGSSSSNDKADEAAQERQRHTDSPSTSSPRHPRRQLEPEEDFSETSPLLDYDRPPPAYSAAVINPYSALSNPQEEHQSAMAVADYGGTAVRNTHDTGRVPESMGGPLDVEEGISPNPRWRGRHGYFRGLCKKLFHLILAIVGSILLIGIIATAVKSKSSNENDDDHPHGTFPSIPSLPKPEPDRSTRPSACPYTSYFDHRHFSFDDPESFLLDERIDGEDLILGGVSGMIRLAPGSNTQKHNIEVEVSYATSDNWVIRKIDVATTETALIVRTPSLTREARSSFNNPCLDVVIDVSVAPGVELENLAINSANLGLHLRSGVDISVSNTTAINARGSVAAAWFDSRKTIIHSGSGSVSGVYSLRDLLSITTESGSINVSVDPKNASDQYPRPAESIFNSAQGSITVKFPTADTTTRAKKSFLPETGGMWSFGVPDRDYRTTVTTKTGSIHGSFLHGSATKLITTSGSITASVYPLHASSEMSGLGTVTRSGTTRLHVHDPLLESGVPVRHLYSSHDSGSGSLHLQFPSVWEGTIKGVAESGSIHVVGKGVEVIEEGRRDVGFIGPFAHRILAKKGHGQSEIGFSSGSGSVSVKIRD